MASVYFVRVFKFQAFMLLSSDQRFHQCMQLTLVSSYVASMLCCHCWMFSLSDALPMQSYPSTKYGSFVSVAVHISARHNLLVSYRSIFLHEIGGILWLTL